MAENVSQIVQEAEQKVREDWEVNDQRYYFDKYVFDKCWRNIWKKIKIDAVKDILMQYHLIEDISDLHAITSPFLDPKQQADNLLYKIVPKAGEYGYYLLYMAIRDSRRSNPLGHTEAVEELKRHAEWRQPPWQQPAPAPIQDTGGRGIPHESRYPTQETAGQGQPSYMYNDGATVRVVGGQIIPGQVPRNGATHNDN